MRALLRTRAVRRPSMSAQRQNAFGRVEIRRYDSNGVTLLEQVGLV